MLYAQMKAYIMTLYKSPYTKNSRMGIETFYLFVYY